MADMENLYDNLIFINLYNISIIKSYICNLIPFPAYIFLKIPIKINRILELLLTIIIIRDVFLRDLARCNTNNCLRAASSYWFGSRKYQNKEVWKRSMYTYVDYYVRLCMTWRRGSQNTYSILVSVRLWNSKDGGF